jgi:dienelactone hydrolase
VPERDRAGGLLAGVDRVSALLYRLLRRRLPWTWFTAAVADDDLADFEPSTFSRAGRSRPVFRRGSGPAVIVISELPCITPRVAAFARRVAELGCTSVLPNLFGRPGQDPYDAGRWKQTSVTARSVAVGCVSREFSTWAVGRTSPVVEWLRALAAAEHARCGGPGVGAVGMCFTGGFALAMATHPAVIAPVLSQPSLPFPLSRAHRASIDCSPDDLDRVRQRCAAEGLTVLGLRFAGDRLSPAARFRTLREQLGEAFVAVELPDAAANPHARLAPHSVLTEHLVDRPGEPTRDVLDQVLGFLAARLLPAAG